MSAANPLICAVNSTTLFTSNAVHTFLAKTAGTITIKRSTGVTVLDAFPVTAGQWIELEMNVDPNGGSIETAGGASGTLTLY